MSIELVTAPQYTPISVDDAKEHSRITTTDDDAYLLQLIKGATEHIETLLNRVLITSTWKYRIDDYFPYHIELPKAPLQSVSSITYIDTDGVSQTLSTDVYTVDTYTRQPRIVEAYNQSFPTTREVINAVTVEFVAGYGEPQDVPKDITYAVMALVDHWYEHRTPESEISLQETPMHVKDILFTKRVFSF